MLQRRHIHPTYQKCIRPRIPLKVQAVIFAALLLAIMASGCAGTQARQEVLGPSLQGIAPRVLDDAAKAPGADRAILERFAANVRAGAWPLALEDWPVIEGFAELGISTQLDRKEIGPNGAVTLRERVRNFGAKLRKQVGVPATP